MSLRDKNLRYAALKLLSDIVAQAMKAEKAEHLHELETSAEDSGAKSWDVKHGAEKIASITLSQRAGGAKILDESALIDYLSDQRPDMLETHVRIKPWASKELLAKVVDYADDGAVTEDGEILPGIVEMAAGDPYQSLRWAKEKGDSTGDEAGRHVMADLIRDGELSHLLEDAGIPLIEK